MTHFARAVGARVGKPEAARADIAKLVELREITVARDAYWAEQVDIQRQVASAFVIAAEGKQDEALKARERRRRCRRQDGEASGNAGVPIRRASSMVQCCSTAHGQEALPPSRPH